MTDDFGAQFLSTIFPIWLLLSAYYYQQVNWQACLIFWWFSNILFREFALISMWRVPETPIGAHKLLAFLSEPLQQPKENLLSLNDPDVSDNLHEFEDWVWALSLSLYPLSIFPYTCFRNKSEPSWSIVFSAGCLNYELAWFAFEL